MDIMNEIRKKAKTEELDYLFLMECLSTYKHPRDKLTKLIKANQLIRIKKSIYVFGKDYRQRPYSLEVLANLIYGPSYVSFEYALSYYNLIPEKVVRITSASYKKNKDFSTPAGEFIYYYIAPNKYPTGITWKSIDENTHFLIATKEKALADYIARLKSFQNKEDLEAYLIQGMRIDKKDLNTFNLALIKDISLNYKNKNVNFLCKILKK
jgi:predicted transcriptional regulator of viral defense system